MIGGYNVGALIELLESADPAIAEAAATAPEPHPARLRRLQRVLELAETNAYAQRVVDSWAAAAWFTAKPELPAEITVTVFKVEGETNTDDLSPPPTPPPGPTFPARHGDAGNPHARRPGAHPAQRKGHPVAYVGDVVGTGSSRKSAINSVLWHTGSDIPHVPNKRGGGVILGGKIAPIFFNTAEIPAPCRSSAT